MCDPFADSVEYLKSLKAVVISITAGVKEGGTRYVFCGKNYFQSLLRLLEYYLVECVDVCSYTCRNDVSGGSVSGVELTAYAESYESGAESLFSFGDRLYLIVVKLVVVTYALLDSAECGIDRAVSDTYSADDLVAVLKNDLSHCAGDVAARGGVALEMVG